MITEERRLWLGTNKINGEIEKAVLLINPKKNLKGLTINKAYNIMAGRTWGKWGPSFTDALEKLITTRQKKEAREKAKYTTVELCSK